MSHARKHVIQDALQSYPEPKDEQKVSTGLLGRRVYKKNMLFWEGSLSFLLDCSRDWNTWFKHSRS